MVLYNNKYHEAILKEIDRLEKEHLVVEVVKPYESCPSGRLLSSLTFHENGSITGFNHENDNDSTKYKIEKGDYVFVNDSSKWSTY